MSFILTISISESKKLGGYLGNGKWEAEGLEERTRGGTPVNRPAGIGPRARRMNKLVGKHVLEGWKRLKDENEQTITN